MLKVAHRVLELLEYICRSPDREFSVTALAQRMGVNKTSVYRDLRVLTERGYLQQCAKTGLYRLDLKLMDLGARTAAKTDLTDLVSPYMERLFQDLGETVNLGVLRGGRVVFIHKIESPHPLRTGIRVGTSVPCHCSALGKAILAWQPDDSDSFPGGQMEEYTPKTITSLPDLLEDLKKARERGYAVERDEYINGITCVAAPIPDRQGSVSAAVSVAGPSVRITAEMIPVIGEKLTRITREISERFGAEAEI